MPDAIVEVGTLQVSGSETPATSFSAVKPAGASSANTLIALVSCPGNRTVTPPAGWTLIPGIQWATAASSGGDDRVEAYSAPGDVSALSFGFSTSTRARIHTRCFSGIDPQIINASARTIYTTSVTAMTAPDVAQNVAGPVPLWVVGLNPNGASSTITVSDPRAKDASPASASINACLWSAIGDPLSDDHTGPGSLSASANTAGKAIAGVLLLWPNGARHPLTMGDDDLVLGAPAAAPYDPTSPKLSWRPPDYSGYTVVHVSNSNRSLTLDNATDYRIVFDSAITALGGLAIVGGRNIVIIGGEIDASGLAAGRTSSQMRGLYLNGQTGQVFVEGLWIHGTVSTSGTAGALGDGIDINQVTSATRRTSVTIQNCRIDNCRVEAAAQQTGAAPYAANEVHPDVIQVYGVVKDCDLRIDKLTGDTTYQGIFCQSGPPSGTAIKDLRRIDIDGSKTYDGTTQVSAYLLYNSFGDDAGRVVCRDVVVRKNSGRTDDQVVSPSTVNFGYAGATVQTGAIAQTNVAAGGVGTGPGMGYVSPGYQNTP